MNTPRDFYEILEIERTATQDEIKKSYRKIALKFHPDRNPGDDEALKRFKEASDAYEILSHDDKKSIYDRYGHAGLQNSGRGAGFQDVGDIFDHFGDIFESFGFGGNGGGRGRGGRGGQQVRRGEHLQMQVQIDLHQAAAGTQKTIKIKRYKTCQTCDGSGAKAGTKPSTCDYCHGNGQIVQSQGFFRLQTTCPACRGSGQVIKEKCATCQGSGMEAETVELEVKIPAGVDTGMQLCLRGEGHVGPNNGPRGDLYLEITVKNHPLFERDGLHLTCKFPITFSQAALGTELEIPVLTGKEKLKVPAGTQPNEVFRIRGKGMPDPRTGKTGDLHVVIQVEVPKKLDTEQKRLLKELAEHEHKNVSPQSKSFFETLKDYFVGSDT
jgi:molecular chaperone DnaJ